MLKLKLQYFGHLMWRADSVEKTGKYWGQEEKEMMGDEMGDGIVDSMDMSLSKLWEIVKGRENWRAILHGVAKSQTRLSDWTTTTPGGVRKLNSGTESQVWSKSWQNVDGAFGWVRTGVGEGIPAWVL